MLSILTLLIITILLLIISEVIPLKQVGYFILGIGMSFILFNLAKIVENINFSLALLYLSVIVLFVPVVLVLYEYVEKIKD